MKSLKDDWQFYCSCSMPENASYTQKTETQKAFYAGAAFILSTFPEMEDEKLTEDESLEHLKSIENEIKSFIDAHK